MSGPIAATFGLDAGLAILAAEAIRGALAVAEGYADEKERRARERDERRDESLRRREAGLAGRLALAEDIGREESRLRRLVSARDLLASRLGETAPAAPALPDKPADDPAAQTAYLQDLRSRADAWAREVDALSARSAGTVPAAELAGLLAAGPSVAEQLAAFEAQARIGRTLPEETVAERRAQAQRILARAIVPPGAGLPEELETLAAELIGSPGAGRAAALASELRLRVDRHNDAATARAAALVLEQSLADLGYEVDGIGETLFVEGGVAHFQRAAWGDYHVRLRVDARRGAMNFNVVRAGHAGDDRGREDLLAEERWCAEFPLLAQTLAKRGIRVSVTRMLGAGEVPVQVVDEASLPRSATEEERRTGAQPKTLGRS